MVMRKGDDIMEILKHFKTITCHKYLVMKGCFAVGLYRQGLLHDLSKYNPEEFIVGAMYYQGDRSPNNAEREQKGYSSAWLHHKGRNKHHYEYWIDYARSANGRVMEPVRMPRKYVAEMVMDRIAASKIYKGKDYTDDAALQYYLEGEKNMLIHPSTKRHLEKLLRMLAKEGEEKTFSYIKNVYLKSPSGKKKNMIQ